MIETSQSDNKPANLMAEGYKALKNRHYSQAARFFEEAAIFGLVQAQYELAVLYEKGMGVRLDSAKARSLYEKAAVKGNIHANEKMSEFVSEGIGGHRNLDEAKQWQEKADSLKAAAKAV